MVEQITTYGAETIGRDLRRFVGPMSPLKAPLV